MKAIRGYSQKLRYFVDHLPADSVRDLEFQTMRRGDPDTLFVTSGSDDPLTLTLSECTDGTFWISCEHVDPENPVSTEEVVERLGHIARGEDFVDEDAVAPRCPYGAYAATIDAALEVMRGMRSMPVAQWPRESRQPHWDRDGRASS